jgi:hypothetical protein
VSLLVADSNGNPQNNQIVTLSLWPVAWSTGSAPCTRDPDGEVWDGTYSLSGFPNWVAGVGGTFYNEDINGNLNLDEVSSGVAEDGYRKYYGGSSAVVATGTLDGLLTPVNSAAGSIPPSVTTDVNGLANFDLTYLKSSAIWTHVRIRASTVVQGTETVSQRIFALPALKADVDPDCYLSPPYTY